MKTTRTKCWDTTAAYDSVRAAATTEATPQESGRWCVWLSGGQLHVGALDIYYGVSLSGGRTANVYHSVATGPMREDQIRGEYATRADAEGRRSEMRAHPDIYRIPATA